LRLETSWWSVEDQAKKAAVSDGCLLVPERRALPCRIRISGKNMNVFRLMQLRDMYVSASGAGGFASASAGLRQSSGYRSRPHIAYFSNYLPSAFNSVPFGALLCLRLPVSVHSIVASKRYLHSRACAQSIELQWPDQATSTLRPLRPVARDVF
jgi:hypothetical protein